MRIFKTKWLARFVRRERITDRSLSEAIERTGRGMTDADLGGGIIKQWVARRGQGRSGGYRTLIAYARRVSPRVRQKRTREYRPRRAADPAGDRGRMVGGRRSAPCARA